MGPRCGLGSLVVLVPFPAHASILQAVPCGHQADAMIVAFFLFAPLRNPRGQHSHFRVDGLAGIRATAR